MLRQSITLMFALAGFGLISGCGGAAMSGDSGTSKDKKKKDVEAIDAAEPYVVTGAYLTCDFVEGGRDVGCSLLDSTGERIKPKQVDSLNYSASVAGGEPIPSTQQETHKWGAVWSGLSQLSKTKFNAAVKTLEEGSRDFSCTGVPCTSRPSGSLSLTGMNGMIQSYNSALYVRDHLSDQPDVFCDNNGDPISEKALESKMMTYTPKNSHMFTGDFWQATGSGFVSIGKQFTLSGKPKLISQFDNPFCLITKGSERYFEGSKCIVAGLRRSEKAQPTVLVYKKTSRSQTTQLQMIPACK